MEIKKSFIINLIIHAIFHDQLKKTIRAPTNLVKMCPILNHYIWIIVHPLDLRLFYWFWQDIFVSSSDCLLSIRTLFMIQIQNALFWAVYSGQETVLEEHADWILETSIKTFCSFIGRNPKQWRRTFLCYMKVSRGSRALRKEGGRCILYLAFLLLTRY